MICYPAVLFPPDEAGLSGCTVPDLLANASGGSPDEALRDATAIMVELTEAMTRKGELFPEPTPAEDVDLNGGTLVLLAVPVPKAAA